jgi:hypothetical protein
LFQPHLPDLIIEGSHILRVSSPLSLRATLMKIV